MGSDPLRRAAAKLREAANACEPGGWTLNEGANGNVWIDLPAYSHAWGMHGFVDEARYGVLMHPPVALALADLLDDFADSVEQDGGVVMDSGTAAAIDVARAVLREVPDA